MAGRAGGFTPGSNQGPGDIFPGGEKPAGGGHRGPGKTRRGGERPDSPGKGAPGKHQPLRGRGAPGSSKAGTPAAYKKESAPSRCKKRAAFGGKNAHTPAKK